MISGKDQLLSSRIAAGLALLALLPFAQLRGNEHGQPVILMGGYFERPPVCRYVLGSKRTILYPAIIGRYARTKPFIPAPGTDAREWDRMIKEARENSLLQLATINPELIRDGHGVIQMAVISTDDPSTASLLLLPSFLHHFSAIFGPELIVAIPARNKIYVFPKLANKLPMMTETMMDDYRISPMPVSTEIFELSGKGLRAIGDFDPDHD